MVNARTKPTPDDYFMGIALAVRARADCVGLKVGAVVVKDRRIVSTGYNGTPENMPNCSDGGCLRCKNRAEYPSGTGYDLCICVHAEQNALLAAARFGIAVGGATVYTTTQPCFGCTKEMLQAGIEQVFYLHAWKHPDGTKQAEYERIQGRFGGGMRQILVEDTDEAWAKSTPTLNPQTDETGHVE